MVRLQHGKAEPNGLLRANRTMEPFSRGAGEDTPLTKSAYGSMRRAGVILLRQARVAPQENLLLLSQQKFGLGQEFLFGPNPICISKSSVGQPSEFPKSLIWWKLRRFCSCPV